MIFKFSLYIIKRCDIWNVFFFKFTLYIIKRSNIWFLFRIMNSKLFSTESKLDIILGYLETIRMLVRSHLITIAHPITRFNARIDFHHIPHTLPHTNPTYSHTPHTTCPHTSKVVQIPFQRSYQIALNNKWPHRFLSSYSDSLLCVFFIHPHTLNLCVLTHILMCYETLCQLICIFDFGKWNWFLLRILVFDF